MRRIEDMQCYEELNIIVFIGNGFDISVLKKYREDKLISSYSKFYDFLCYKNFNKDNIFLKKMKHDKYNKDNWSDFENAIYSLKNNYCIEDLQKDLEEIQKYFLLFLNEIVTPDILIKLNREAQENEWAKRTLQKFLADLPKQGYEKIKFPKRTYHHKKYKYTFFNFNYTMLFDNYIYLDKNQHTPEKHRTINTNFEFMPNPNSYNSLEHSFNENTQWSGRVSTELMHPHGNQSVPRSLLFGIENQTEKVLNKSYWAEMDEKYDIYFNKKSLFIIYGSSIGKSDSWWWNKVYHSIEEFDSELIIYYYSREKDIKEDEIKDIFLNSCDFDRTIDQKVKNNIFIVIYDNNDKLNAFSLSY